MINHYTKTLPLDGKWLICIDPDNIGRENQWHVKIPSGAVTATVPGVIQDSFSGYHGLAWYYKEFVPAKNTHIDGRYLLRFHEIDFASEIWLNGTKIGSHEGLEEIFTLDISNTVKPSQSNLLAIRVLSPTNEPIDGMVLGELPVGRRQYPEPCDHAYATGGIIGSVEVLLSPKIYIDDIYAVPDWKTGNVNVRTTLNNAGAARITLRISSASAVGGQLLTEAASELEVGKNAVISESISIPNHRLWELNDPYMYRITVRIYIHGSDSIDERTIRIGFRDFRFERGYFRFNGKRIKINGALYTILSLPAMLSIPYDEGLLMRDILNMKAMGFNFVRVTCGSPIPRQLDILDEMGILVLEENFGAGWAKETPRTGDDWVRSITRVIKRDRNHPSIVIWSLLNEQQNTKIFRYAVKSPPAIRELDQTRLLILNSGRFDKDGTIGNICNPYKIEWSGNLRDEHWYPSFPHTSEIIKEMISPVSNFGKMGIPYNPKDGEPYAPLLLTEYGVCGAEDLPHYLKRYEMINKTDAGDAKLYRRKYNEFLAEWNRMKLDQCWARPEDYFRDSHKNLAALILDDYNCWSANPAIIGSFSSTQIIDAWFHGCGITTAFRKMKPGMADIYTDIFSTLRFSLFTDPVNAYNGSVISLEAYLINEDALKMGKYELYFKVIDPEMNCVMDDNVVIEIPDAFEAELPFSMKVFCKKIAINGPSGTYRFIAGFVHGAEAEGGESVFYITSKTTMPEFSGEIILWGEDNELAGWLTQNSISWLRIKDADTQKGHCVLVSGKAPASQNKKQAFDELNHCIANGSTAVFLTPEILTDENQNVPKSKVQALKWAPFDEDALPSLYTTDTWYFRCDHWAKKHVLFNGLPAGGILDYRFYRDILKDRIITGLQEPFDTIAGAFQLSGANSVKFDSGTLLTVHKYQKGRFILNTLDIRDNIGKDPVAEHLLRNLIIYACGAGKPA